MIEEYNSLSNINDIYNNYILKNLKIYILYRNEKGIIKRLNLNRIFKIDSNLLKGAYIIYEDMTENIRNIVICQNNENIDTVKKILDVQKNWFIPSPYNEIIYCINEEEKYKFFEYNFLNGVLEKIGTSKTSNTSEILRDYRVEKYCKNESRFKNYSIPKFEENNKLIFYFNNNDEQWFNILKLYCKENEIEFYKKSNPFINDSSENYIIKIDKEKIFQIIFIDFCCESGLLFGFKIYNKKITQCLDTFNDIFLDNSNFEESHIARKLNICIYGRDLLNEIDFELFEEIQNNFEQQLNYDNAFSLIDELKFTEEICRKSIESFILNNGYYNLSFNHLNSPKTYDEKILRKCLLIKNELFDKLVSNEKIKIKWKREYELYKLVKKYFNSALFQYKVYWLNSQSIDIYIYDEKIAIEYQGEQHFKDIEYFDVKDTLKERVMRDNVKKEKCKENGVTLIEWRYDEEISNKVLKDKLNSIGIKIDFTK